MQQKWFKSSDIPYELNDAQSRYSVDVLIYDKKTNEHSVAWYDHIVNTWQFLCREPHGVFFWRFFDEKTDYPKVKK